MAKHSAGILMYRLDNGFLEVLIVHPGGPLWTKRDEGAWSIPKGEFLPGEDPLEHARREFEEELGTSVSGEFLPLKPVRQSGGKLVHAFAVEGDLDTDGIVSNTFSMEWPPRSGRMQEFPEVDRAEWCAVDSPPARGGVDVLHGRGGGRDARRLLNPAQTAFLDELAKMIGD